MMLCTDAEVHPCRISLQGQDANQTGSAPSNTAVHSTVPTYNEGCVNTVKTHLFYMTDITHPHAPFPEPWERWQAGSILVYSLDKVCESKWLNLMLRCQIKQDSIYTHPFFRLGTHSTGYSLCHRCALKYNSLKQRKLHPEDFHPLHCSKIAWNIYIWLQ